MNLFNSFVLTAVLFITIFFFELLKGKQEEVTNIELEKGASGILSFIFTSATEGTKQNIENQKFVSQEGTISEEINKIRNKISYPPQALEEGLESECEWSITVNSKQRASNIKTLKACRYKIFEEEFMRVVADWDFTLPENTILQIPVSFKIK